MTFDEKTVEIIEAIGLSNTQAKVYLTLMMLGKAKARTICKGSGVARQDVYRVLSELQGKGLVEKLIAMPTEYKAIPIDDGISILLKHKAQEYKKLAEKTEEVLGRLKSISQERKEPKEYELKLVSRKNAETLAMQRFHNSAQNNIDIIDTWDSFKYLIENYSELHIEAAKRGVKYRFLTGKPLEGEPIPKCVQTLKKFGAILRHTCTKPQTSVTIVDKKYITICMVKSIYVLKEPILISDNPILAALIQDYFEKLWNDAEKNPT